LPVSLEYLVILILVANGAPILIRNILGNIADCPLDAGKTLVDQHPVFGSSKTWRGVFASVIFTVIAALLLGYDFVFGLMVAVLAMAGDLLSSFIKRRLKMQPSRMALFLDQVPESLFPALYMMQVLSLMWKDVLFIVMGFIVLGLVLSKILFRLGLRQRPY
jgi:CDP-archaeol synthase